MLGFIHKRVLRKCHPLICQACPFAPSLDADYHSKALNPFTGGVSYQKRLHDRSIYAYILIYNRLPEVLVNLPSVSSFQAKLTHLAKERARLNQESWRRSFQDLTDLNAMFYRS